MVLDYVIEAPEQGVVQNLWVIGRGNDQTVRLIMFNHLKKAVENASNLPNIVSHSTLRSDGIEFVEEVDSSHLRHCIEYLP